MGIVLTFVINAGLNLVLGLAVAGVLGPAEYGRFALASMLAIVLCTALFDWLRLSTTRFAGEADAGESLRASLFTGYCTVAFAVFGFALLADGIGFGLAGVPVILVAAAAVANALFEFRAADARAQFQDKAYLRLVIAKNVLALVLMVAAAWLMADAVWVIGMLALSAAIAVFAGGGMSKPGKALVAMARRADLTGFARYGLPIVGANLVYQVIVLANRGLGADAFGLAEAGKLSLATDLTIRLFLSAGAALDAYLFQLAVRRRSEGGQEAGDRQIAANMLIVAAVLGFCGACFVVGLPSVQAIVIPEQYRDSFAALGTVLVPGVIAFCFMQFGLNPIFQLHGRTGIVIWTALAALVLDLALVWLMPRSLGITGIVWAHSCALVAGGIAALLPALRVRGCWPAWRDWLAVAVATLAAGLAMWPMRGLGSPWAVLSAAGLTGSLVFVGGLAAFDVLSLRVWLRKLLGRLGPLSLPLARKAEAR